MAPRLIRCVLAFTALVLLASCATSQPSLFQRAGGTEALKKSVADFRVLVPNDPLIGKRFQGLPAPIGDDPLYILICQLVDGPCRYDGPAMVEIHRGMDVTPPELERFLSLLKTAMTQQSVPATAQGEIVTRLLALRGDIVGR
jgi:hemoglobin